MLPARLRCLLPNYWSQGVGVPTKVSVQEQHAAGLGADRHMRLRPGSTLYSHAQQLRVHCLGREHLQAQAGSAFKPRTPAGRAVRCGHLSRIEACLRHAAMPAATMRMMLLPGRDHLCTTRVRSTTKVLSKRMQECYRISLCCSHRQA